VRLDLSATTAVTQEVEPSTEVVAVKVLIVAIVAIVAIVGFVGIIAVGLGCTPRRAPDPRPLRLGR
jgi:hypothetical protein